MRTLNQLCLLFAIIPLLSSCKKDTQNQKVLSQIQTTSDSLIFNEDYRPQFHFSPPSHWMNDPNGLVYNDGIYHLFYQYYPDDTVWGPMHWGHATSTDLIQWKHKPIALYPDEHGYIFSGSAVVDTNNSSGFGSKDNPPLVAMFTYHNAEMAEAGAKNYQTQGLAYSIDNGDTWTKYEGNPVVGNDGMIDFRDPKVFWSEEYNKWVLILVAGDHAKFYQSDNLKNWSQTGEFGKNSGAHGGVWECPDLFKLKVGNAEEEKWVLLISINPGGPNKGSATQYFVGEFDGTTFTPDHKDTKWLDYGMDNYAGITYNNTPNNERIFVGWMSNWLYGQQTPTEVWRSAMTLPRTLQLFSDNGMYYLKNYPIKNLDKISQTIESIENIDLKNDFIYESPDLMASDISFEANLSETLKISFSNSQEEHFDFVLDPSKKEMFIDRSQSGIIDFGKDFATQNHVQPYEPTDKSVEFRIIVDKASVELFINKGKYVFTSIVFPNEDYDTMKISSVEKGNLNSFKISKINSIWNE